MTTLSKIPTPAGRVRRAVRRILFLGISLVIVLIPLELWVLWPWMSTWGATEEEISQSLPGDELVPAANLQTTKGIAIDARPDQIYPWLRQLGVDRGGLYRYDWLDNLPGLRVKSAREIVPAWQTLQVGDFIRFTPKDDSLNPATGLYVRRLEVDQWLVTCFGQEDKPDEVCLATWQFVLTPQADGSTRLLLRARLQVESGFQIKLTHPFQFVMERKMLLSIRDRAEGLAASWPQP